MALKFEHLVEILLKFATILTLLRLASTALNWQFGVSRQYLRLLELLFRLGQRRIDRVQSSQPDDFVDSGHAAASICNTSPALEPTGDAKADRAEAQTITQSKLKRPPLHTEDAEERSRHGNNNNAKLRTGQQNGHETNGSIDHGPTDGADKAAVTSLLALGQPNRRYSAIARPTSLVANGSPKARRISTPDGPPVFLLDGYSDSDDYEDETEDSSEALEEPASRGTGRRRCHRRANWGRSNGRRLSWEAGELDVSGLPAERMANALYGPTDEDEEAEWTSLSRLDDDTDHHHSRRPRRNHQELNKQAQEPAGQMHSKSDGQIHESDVRQSRLLDQQIQMLHQTVGPKQHRFHLADPCKLIVRAIDALVDDQVTKRFTPEELDGWNLLTRTNARNYQFMSRSLGLFWLFGLIVRYSILLPMRIMFTLAGFIWLMASMSLIGLLPKASRLRPYKLTSLMAFRMLSCGITSHLEFHNRQYRAKGGQICVANHTSPLDVVLLACDNCYALVGQKHAGLLGILERFLSRASNHVWFDRFEIKDRQLVSRRIKEHVQNKHNLPILIFPEGTCINNSAVMMFKKGTFETTNTVCPVAIKYDARFGDPFWNSSKQTYLQYLLLMMSSWAIKCEVWYLPPMERLPGEQSFEFAGRVKAEIAKQGGLADLNWDGQLKRMAAKIEWKHQQQEDFVKRLKLD